jgi:hypothetical protein
MNRLAAEAGAAADMSMRRYGLLARRGEPFAFWLWRAGKLEPPYPGRRALERPGVRQALRIADRPPKPTSQLAQQLVISERIAESRPPF